MKRRGFLAGGVFFCGLLPFRRFIGGVAAGELLASEPHPGDNPNLADRKFGAWVARS